MPYKLSDNGLCVLRSDTGAEVKCHATKDEAQAHLAALSANVTDAIKASVVKASEGVFYGVLLKPGIVDEQGDLVTDVAIEKAARRLNAREVVTIDVDHETEHVEKAAFHGAFVVPEDMTIAGEKFGAGWLVVKYRAPEALVGSVGHSLEAKATGRVVKTADGDEKRLLEDIEITGFAIVRKADPAVDGPTVAADEAKAEEVAQLEGKPVGKPALAVACEALHKAAAECGDNDTAAKCSAMASQLHKMLDSAEKKGPTCEHCGAPMAEGMDACPKCGQAVKAIGRMMPSFIAAADREQAGCAHKDLAKRFYKIKGRRPAVEHIHKAAMVTHSDAMAECASACSVCASACRDCVDAGCDSPSRQRCKDACDSCAQACDACASACRGVPGMEACVAACLACARACRECSDACSSGASDCAKKCSACAESCSACAVACGGSVSKAEMEYDLEETADGKAYVFWTRPGDYADVKDYEIEDMDGASLLMAVVDGELAQVGYRFSREKWTPEAIVAYLAEHVQAPAEPVAERQVASAGAVFSERMTAQALTLCDGYEIKSAGGVEWVEGIATVAESGVRLDLDAEVLPSAVAELVETGRLKSSDLMMDHGTEADDKAFPHGRVLQKVGQLLGDPMLKWGTLPTGEPVLKAQSRVGIFDTELIARHKRAKAAGAPAPYQFSHDSDVSGIRKADGRKVVHHFDRNYNIALVNRAAHAGCTWQERQAASLKAIAESHPREVAMNPEEKALRDQALRLAEVTGKMQAFSERDMASVRAFIAEAPLDKLGKPGDPPVEYVYTEMHAIRLKNAAQPVPQAQPAEPVAGVVPGTFVDVREKASAMVCDFFAAAESPRKLHLESMDELLKRYYTSVAPEFKSERTQAGLKYAALSAAGFYLDEYHKRSDVYADDYVEDITERRKAAYAVAGEKVAKEGGRFDSERQKAAVLTTGIDQATADAVGKIPHPGYAQTEVDDDGMFSVPLDEMCDYEAKADFQTSKIINSTEFELPLAVTEGNSYQEMQAMSDYQETYSVTLYGGIVTVSEQAEANAASIKIIEQIPDKMYRAMQRRRRRIVTEVLRANTATAGGAGNTLFSAGNLNANTNAYTFDQFVALLVTYCTQRAYGHGVNNQDIEHLRNKPTWVLSSVVRLFDMLRDMSLDTNPASTNRNANQAVMAFGNLKFYAANDWDTASSTARIVIGGAKKLFRVGDYKGIKTPQIFINNNQQFGVSFSSPVKQFAVKWGGGAGIQDPRFAAAFTG